MFASSQETEVYLYGARLDHFSRSPEVGGGARSPEVGGGAPPPTSGEREKWSSSLA